MLAVAAQLAHIDQDLAAAATAGADGAALAREAGDGRARADALLWGARARFRLGNWVGAARRGASGGPVDEVAERPALLEGSLARWRELGEPWGVAQALEFLGAVTRDSGDPQGALPHYE